MTIQALDAFEASSTEYMTTYHSICQATALSPEERLDKLIQNESKHPSESHTHRQLLMGARYSIFPKA